MFLVLQEVPVASFPRVTSRTAFPLAFLVVASALALPRHSSADWPVNGLRVSPSATAQSQLSIALDAAGGIYIAWADDQGGTWVRHLTSAGEPAAAWSEIGGATFTTTEDPMLIADGAGGVYFAADNPNSRSNGVHVTRISSDGPAAPGWSLGGILIPNSGYTAAAAALAATPFDTQSPVSPSFAPVLALGADGGPLVAWDHFPFTNTGLSIHETRFTAVGQTIANWGVTGGLIDDINVAPSVICTDGVGGLFTAYSPYPGTGVRVHHISADAAQHASVAASSNSTGGDSPGLVSDGTGGAFVFWQDDRTPAIKRPFVQRVLPDGTYAPGWPSDGISLSPYPTEAGTLRHVSDVFTFNRTGTTSSVASDGAGGAYVAWTDDRDDAAGDIYAQHVLADGSFAPGWPVDGLPICTVIGAQNYPTVGEDGLGGLLVSWQDARNGSFDIYAQHVDAGGMASSWPAGGMAVCVAESSQVLPQVISAGPGEAIVAWVDSRDSSPQIYAAHMTYDAAVGTMPSFEGSSVTSGTVRVTWFAANWSTATVDVERRKEGQGWAFFDRVRPEPDGRLIVADHDVVPGGRYGYRLSLGAQVWSGETWVTVPGAQFALQAIRPNPIAGRVAAVTFAVPAPGRVSLDVLDVSGRNVASRQINANHAGSYTEALEELAALPAGMYVIRLSQAGRSAAARACVVH